MIEVRASGLRGIRLLYFPVVFVDGAQSTGSQAVLAFVAKNAPDGTLSVMTKSSRGPGVNTTGVMGRAGA